MRVRRFVVASAYDATKIQASNLALPHDADLGASNTFLELNYQWRRLIPYLFNFLYDSHLYTGTENEIETAVDNVDKLIAGLYKSANTMTVVKSHITTPVSVSSQALIFPTPDYDIDGFWSSGTPTRFTVPTGLAGIYQINAGLGLNATNGAISKQADIRLNGTNRLALDYIVTDERWHTSLSCEAELSEGDYIELWATIQGDTANLFISGLATFISLSRVSSE